MTAGERGRAAETSRLGDGHQAGDPTAGPMPALPDRLRDHVRRSSSDLNVNELESLLYDAADELDRLRAALEAIADVDQLPKFENGPGRNASDLYHFRLGELSAARIARKALSDE